MPKIKAVVDTNVIVSGIISSNGSPRKIIELAKEGMFTVLTSAAINREILEVFHRDHIYTKYGLSEAIMDDIASFLYEGSVMTQDRYSVMEVQRDPQDNKFISCALEGDADYIVSGDAHLLDLKHYRGLQIVNASTFLKILQRHRKIEHL